MKICKYCKKSISDEQVWNPDEEGNGYHHACLCEMEFRSRDRQIYDKGRADVLDKIRAEIMQLDYDTESVDYDYNDMVQTEIIHTICREEVLQIIDKYKAEVEPQERSE